MFMKFGIKTFGDRKFVKYFEKKADFLEIMAINGRDYSFLRSFPKPIIIHAEHQKFGINYADRSNILESVNSIRLAISLANKFKSEKIITHLGMLTEKTHSVINAVSLIRYFKDERIFIENLPSRGNYIGTTPEEMKVIFKETGARFCLDINHAISAAMTLKRDPFEMLNQFINMNPKHYHIGGQNSETDECHLSFRDSNIDLGRIIKMIPENAEITLETTTDIRKIEEDIETIRSLF